MSKNKTFIYLIISLLITLGSCNKTEDPCPDSQAYDLKISFTKITNSELTSLKIYHPDVGVFTTDQALPFLVSIPVDVTSDSTSFYIDFIYENNSTKVIKTDTIMFSHISTTYLHRYECGFIMSFEITDSLATSNYIDSVSWVSNSIGEDSEINLEIFY